MSFVSSIRMMAGMPSARPRSRLVEPIMGNFERLVTIVPSPLRKQVDKGRKAC